MRIPIARERFGSDGGRATGQRPLIYWTQAPSEMLREELARRDWKVTAIAHASELHKGTGEITGGILDLSGGHADAIGAIASVCTSMYDIAWVALVDAGQTDSSKVRALLRDYCFDYITLPAPHQRIADTVDHAYGMECLFASDREPLVSVEPGIIGTCSAMLRLFETVRRFARTEAPVFVSGETGTGKELTAVAIHRNSARRNGPFVAVNCGAIPPHLLQSELFGYERGAFTGANARNIGYVEAANGGTLLLDEIGDLPYESQTSLLRFLQEREIHRLGGRDPVSVDVRIVSATHVDLRDAIEDGRFRADLFHRLCVMRIDQPPLRARGKDIELLAHHVLERFRADASQRVRGFSTDAITALYKHDWPGNVRELINRVHRAIVMTEGRLITARDLELERCLDAASPSVAAIRKSIEREVIEHALLRTRGRIAASARELGVSRATLYRWMDAYGINRPRRTRSSG
ncbi:sigma-54 dependent transcriptional regulator [Burkholderia ubonensis]|uniref:sigma-54 dependent transcriptional regulator n=1 Tax=Burkholderia ubonensis TaxID=101571 RepID=UPI000759A58D|nr:sigma-54 dependent transcriptional regulator [Burkholderia ubonensis]KVK98239.1 Fis family transcriptional regulator [Burkholderia ubonensis]KVN68779.1 Fis family transcriptional regulator [Burkholderia ubonensis]KVO29655.1 Fis family transcriptional regulator [Burkholderia ubonensis]KVQ49351.1 Fis family transcriptional regulator [Burkholderia ubonensis]